MDEAIASHRIIGQGQRCETARVGQWELDGACGQNITVMRAWHRLLKLTSINEGAVRNDKGVGEVWTWWMRVLHVGCRIRLQCRWDRQRQWAWWHVGAMQDV